MDNTFKPIFESELQNQIAELDAIEIPKGTLILKEEAFIKEIPLVISGKIKVRKTDESGKELVLYHIVKGESCILSITSCLNNKQSNAEAITQEDTALIVVPSDKVKVWMNTYKSWRKFVMQLYYDRLSTLLNLVDSISFKQTDSRLYDLLKSLQEKQGSTIHITHQELANQIGTAREVISRLLKQMEKEGIICLERGEIKIIQPL